MPSHRAYLFRALPHTPVARWSSMSTPCAPVDLIGTKRIVAGVTASQIAPAYGCLVVVALDASLRTGRRHQPYVVPERARFTSQ